MSTQKDAPRPESEPAGRGSGAVVEGETEQNVQSKADEMTVAPATLLDNDFDLDVYTALPRKPIIYLKKHLRLFEARGIPEALAASYALRSYTEEEARKFLDRRDVRGTFLYIPSRGEGAYTPRLRADDPDANGGVRYLTSRGAEVVPFPLNGVQQSCDEPVFIVEAPLKALSLEAHGFGSTIGLGGVSAGAFRKGTTELRPELQRVVTKGRPFYIVFDSNTSTKPPVAHAQAKLALALCKAGASVRLVTLPPDAKGREQGPDDFLVTNGAPAFQALVDAAEPAEPIQWVAAANTPEAAADLLRRLPFQAALIVADRPTLDLVQAGFKRHKITTASVRAAVDQFRAALAKNVSQGAVDAPSYVIDAKGRICAVHTGAEGADELRPLCNFNAKIVEEIIFDDGAEKERVFVLEGVLEGGKPLPTARVRATEFADGKWIYPLWGAKATPAAGRLVQEQLREAIQSLSQPVSRTVFRHTGWRELGDDKRAFLFHGGAVASDDMSVELEGPLAKFVLPPRIPDQLTEAIEAALGLLEVAPLTVTVPLLAAAFLAPLSPALRPDFVVWLVGPTGSLKSELAALAQAFFGAGFTRTTLPGSWTSTENALEGQLFAAKDVLFTVDDYAPQATLRGHQALQERASRIIRSVGNGSSRSRLRQDLTQRPDRPPRGMVLVTGEEMPVGASILARVVRVDIDRAEVNLQKLTELQDRRPLLSLAMRAYVEMLRPRLPALRDTLPDRHRKLRAEFVGGSAHMRQPDSLAALEVAFQMVLTLAEESIVLGSQELEHLSSKAHAALLELGTRNADKQRDSDPAATFVNTLRALIAQGRIRLAPKGAELELHADAGCDPIGWEDATYVYLMPDLAHQAVVRFAQSAGSHFGVSVDQLKRLLLDRGLLIRPEGSAARRLEVSVRVGARTERAIRLRRETLIEPHRPTPEEAAEEQTKRDSYTGVLQ